MLDCYNTRSKWASAGIWKRPEFDVDKYQKALNRITGVSPSGAPVVRLTWAWDARKWENTEWDGFGVATNGEWRQRYRALSIDIGEGDYVDIAPPRWMLEQLHEPAQLAQSWELTRYRLKVVESVPAVCRHCGSAGRFYDVNEQLAVFARWDKSQIKENKVFIHWVDTDRSEGQFLLCRFCGEDTVLRTVNEDVWGPLPREGVYYLLPNIGIVATHTDYCCKKAAEEERQVCYGTYKEPGSKELDRLKKAVFLRDKEMATNPHIRPDMDVVALEQARRWGLQMMEDQEVKKRTELAEIKQAHRFNNNIVYA